jgi:murein DD-endopeptidase MepM/ murein hydrolase activator NlpD
LLTLLLDLLTALLGRKPSWDTKAHPRIDAPARGRRARRVQTLGLVTGGLVLMALTLRGGEKPAQPLPPAAPVATVEDQEQPEPTPTQQTVPSTQSLPNPADGSIPVTVFRSYPFIWPADGPLTSEIGPWHPLGIDIGMEPDEDSPVRAAARGTVTFAGGSEADDYGFHVIIDHGGGLATLYGHLSEVVVQEGQAVRQGDYIGLGGDSGKAEGKHLHFEVRYNGSQINPEQVLPGIGAQPEALPADCAKEALVIDSGAPLMLDFSAALTGTSIARATLSAVNVSPDALPASVARETATRVLLDTSPTVRGTGGDDEYAVTVTPTGGGPELTCTVFVRTKTVRTVFYVRPTRTPTPLPPPEHVPPTLTPTPTNTPTPTPTPTKTPYPTRPR